jgi:hypothetical protein
MTLSSLSVLTLSGTLRLTYARRHCVILPDHGMREQEYVIAAYEEGRHHHFTIPEGLHLNPSSRRIRIALILTKTNEIQLERQDANLIAVQRLRFPEQDAIFPM